MRLAYIDSKITERYVVQEEMIHALREKNIEFCISRSVAEFEEAHGLLSAFDGLIFHPGLRNQREITKLQVRYPSLPFAVVSALPEDYESDSEHVYDYENIEGILSYFEKTLAQKDDLQKDDLTH